MMPRPLVSLWRQVARGTRTLVDRRAADHDVSDEVRDYLVRATESFIAHGMSRADAERAARLEIGNETLAIEQVRGYGWENGVEAFVADVRYALRRLRASPVLTITATLTLALGIGAATAIFSAVNPILFEPLPYPKAGRLVTIVEARSDGSRIDGTFGMYRELIARSRSLENGAAFKPWQTTLTGGDQPERFDGQRVSASYFRVLGIAPSIGRDFQVGDDQPGQPPVAMISDALWRARFASEPSIVGRQITLDDTRYTVIGILPRTFENVLAPSAQLWTTLQYDMSQPRAWGHHLRVVGRLRDGVSPADASRELDAIAHSVLREQRPTTYGPDLLMHATSLQSDVTRSVRPALLALLVAVSLVLAIACMNVTNLLVANGMRRRGELALRAALGATRGRLSRQLLTENLLLALMGGAVAMIVAAAGVQSLVRLAPTELPRVGSISLNGGVFVFGFTVTTMIGAVLGLVLARHQPRVSANALGDATPRATAGARRMRRTVVVVEVALAFMLLVSSGLLLRSLERLFSVSPGFDSSNLVTMQVQTSAVRFPDRVATSRFFEQVLDGARDVPGVETAALTSQLPLSGDVDEYGVHFEWRPANEGNNAFRYAVTPGYMEAMGIPVRVGRSFTATDRAGAPLVALISESFAKRGFAGVDPIGKRVRIGPPNGPLYAIIGVVGDVRQQSLALDESEAIYVPASQWQFGDNTMSLVVKTRAPLGSIAPLLRRAVWSIDKDQPIVRVTTMRDLVLSSAAERRFALEVFAAFALAALILSAAGLYGVLAGSVAERTREIGVRAALGATRAGIRALVVRDGMRLALLGAAIGCVGAIGASKAMTTMLFGITASDPLTYVAVASILLIVCAAACWIPAWRASRVDPAITLRATANG